MITFLFWSLQFPCATSGSWGLGWGKGRGGQVLLMRFPTGIQWGCSHNPPFHPHCFIPGTTLVYPICLWRGEGYNHTIWKMNTETLDFIFCAITFALQTKSRHKDRETTKSPIFMLIPGLQGWLTLPRNCKHIWANRLWDLIKSFTEKICTTLERL